MESSSRGIDGCDDRRGCCWKSATAGMVADCVALCCCPCAVVNLLTLALVKAPWKLGRRCFGGGRRRRRSDGNGNGVLLERKEEGTVEMEVPAEMDGGEAEKVWFELYEFGHLGFGRVSFTGIRSLTQSTQPQGGKGN